MEISDYIVLADCCLGIYMPQRAIENLNPKEWGISEEDTDILLAGPETDYYWETWDMVSTNAKYTDSNGIKWYISFHESDGSILAVKEGAENESD